MQRSPVRLKAIEQEGESAVGSIWEILERGVEQRGKGDPYIDLVLPRW
jgi:hypothetical protein